MRLLTVRLAMLRSGAGRYVAATIAIAISTAFLAASLIAVGLFQQALTSASSADVKGADLVISPSSDMLDASDGVLDDLRSAPGVDGVWATGYAYGTVTSDNVPVGVTIDPSPTDEKLAYYELVSGERPTGPDQITLDEATAKTLDVGVGGTVELSSDATSGEDMSSGGRSVTVTGLTTTSSAGAGFFSPAVATVAEDQMTALASPEWDSDLALIRVDTADGADTAGIDSVLADAGLPKAQTYDEYVDEQNADLVGQSSLITVLAIVFVAVALLVTVLVVSTTFSVIVAQRSRQLALLRMVGARTSQIRSLVLGESFAIGLIGSVLGVAIGVGLLAAARSLLSGGAAASILDGTIPPSAIVFPLIAGVLVTLVAGFGPARRATRVRPIAALQPQDGPISDRRTGWFRRIASLLLAIGGLVLMFGCVLLGQNTDDTYSSTYTMLILGAILGGAVSLIGILWGSVFVVPHLTKALSYPVRWIVGLPAKLAGVNSARNPRRTASTVSALLIGATLLAMMSVGGVTAKATLQHELDTRRPYDLSATVPGAPDAAAAAVSSVAGIEDVYAAQGANVSITTEAGGQSDRTIAGVDPAQLDEVTVKPGLAQGIQDDQVYLSESTASQLGVKEGDDVTVKGASGESKQLTAHVNGRVAITMVTTRTAQELQGSADETYVLAKVAPQGSTLRGGQSANQVVSDVQRKLASVAPDEDTDVTAPFAEREMYATIINVMLNVVTILLGVAVIIAVVGVANTLSLSTIERTHENALLRALGMSRAQLRRMLAAEGVLIALVGTLGGLVLGTVYGIAGAFVILGQSVETGIVVALPWGRFGIIAVGAILAGVLASVLPARRALTVEPSEALAEVD